MGLQRKPIPTQPEFNVGKVSLLAERQYSFGATHPPTVSYVVFDVTYGGRDLRWEGRSLSDGEGNSSQAPLSARRPTASVPVATLPLSRVSHTGDQREVSEKSSIKLGFVSKGV